MGQVHSEPGVANRSTTPEEMNVNSASNILDGSSGSAPRDEAVLEAKHKVFLSHSGAQKNFVEQVCVDLERCDRYPFFDKRRHSLGIGQHFPEAIFRAIRQCQVGVLILSEEFFTRTKWPMLELAAMVESKKHNLELVIMPVFLGISREQCRKVENHKRWESVWLSWRQIDSRIDVEKWKQALSIFGATNGLIYNEVLGEVKFREEIVEAICERVPPETRWDDSHVQGKSRLCQVIREKVNMAQVSKSFGVKVVGLYGVGGLGKTTICKSLCNNYFKEFQGRVAHVEFESDVEVELMHGVLRKLTDTRREVLAGFDKGECSMHLKAKVHQHNVFLAIDNVHDTKEAIEQARAYLRASFTHGSVVIVTAHSKEVLKGVGVAMDDCVKMPTLNAIEARSLFLHQVLGVPDEINAEDEAHIMRCVKLCRFHDGDKSGFSYLPLALKLLGVQHSSTLGYDPRRWVEGMRDTSDELMVSVFEILRGSFDALRDDDKLLFMDSVLYYPGRCMRTNVGFFDLFESLNIFEWLSVVHQASVKCVKLRLEELKRKSVIEEVGDGVDVHDLWREFAIKETKAGQLEFRRWVYVIGDEKSGFEEVEPSGIRWGELRRMCFVSISSFSGMKGPMLTKLQYCSNVTVLHLTGSNIDLIDMEVLDLTVLKCLKSLVLEISMSNIRVCGLGTLKSLGLLGLAVGHISSACMEDIGRLTSLQFLHLSCTVCEKLPDLANLKLLQVVHFDIQGNISKLSGLSSMLSGLKQLSLRFSNKEATCTCYDICNLVALEELEIMGSVIVEEVFNLQKLTKLQRLSVSGCQSIKALSGLNDLVALKSFQFCGCKPDCCKLGVLQDLPTFSKLTNLEKLDISYQNFITKLEGLRDVVSIQELKANHCHKLHEVPDMGRLAKLRKLDISWCPVQSLAGLGELVALEVLEAQHCSELNEIPDLHKLSNLQNLDLGWCPLRTVRGLDGLEALELFSVQHCGELVALPELCKLRGLRELDISHCSSLKSLHSLQSLSNLEKLKGDWQILSKLHKLPSQLRDLTSVGWGSQELAKSTSLECLSIFHCSELDELSSLTTMPNLYSLKLKKCHFRGVLGLINCTSLLILEIISCRQLERLPDLLHLQTLRILHKEDSKTMGVINMGNLPQLQTLECENLAITDLPDLSSCCPRLNFLRVWDCEELQSLTSSGPLTALRALNVTRCGSLRSLPHLKSSTTLKSLRVIECGILLTRPDFCNTSRWPNVEWQRRS